MVEEVTHYTATATRRQRYWFVQCDQHPEAMSTVTRLADAADHQREAIAWVTDTPEDTIDVDIRPALPDDVAGHLTAAQRHRDEAAQANTAAAHESRLAARSLSNAGLTLRDIGTVLGISYQRVQQLLTDHAA